MTRLVRIPLGNAPGTGKQRVDAAVTFKNQMRAVLPSVDGAWLITVTDHGKRGIEAVYDADTAGAKEWSEKAAELAPGIWETIQQRRKEIVR